MFRGIVGFQIRALIRYSLHSCGISFLGRPTLYHVLITAHALVIIFFSIMPILIGRLGNLLLPIIVGKRDIDLPRWNAFSFWATLSALALLLIRAFVRTGAATS